MQSGSDAPASDLAATLAKWQAAGMIIRLLRADAPAAPAAINVRSLGLLGRLNQWLRRASLRGDPREGFGRMVPHTHAG